MTTEAGGQRGCPICAREQLPRDASGASLTGERIVVAGRVNAIIRPEEAHYPPYADYCTVSVYTRRRPVVYLKFRTPYEMNRWPLERDQAVEAEGCLHVVDGKRLLFDVSEFKIHGRR